MTRELFQTFFKPGEVCEIRALGLTGKGPWEGYAKGTVSGYFDDPAKFARAAIEIDALQKASGIYFTLNPVDPALLARANNRLAVLKTTSTDNQITCQRWLLIDTDPVRPSGISATDSEMESAIELSYRIADYLSENGFPEPITANSGNGGHLIYLLPNLPNTTEISELKARALKALSQIFNTPQITIDEKVFNAARIVKLYGTWARKGDSTNTRPHRRSHLDHVPAPLIPVTLERLQWLAEQGLQPETLLSPSQSEKGPSNGNPGRLDVETYLRRYGQEISRLKKESTRTIYGLKHCVFNPEHAQNDASIVQMADGKLLYQCFHNTCQGRTWAEARQIISGSDSLARFFEGYNPDQTKQNQVVTGACFNQLRERFSQKTEWIYRKLIPKGQPTLFNGREGDGKTTICLQAAKETLETHPNGIIVWIASEGTIRNTFTQMADIGLTSDRFLIAQKTDGDFLFNFGQKADLSAFEAFLTSFDVPILAIFLDSLCGISAVPENESQIGRIMYRLNSLVCDRFGSALIYLHHLNKSGQGSLLNQSSGSTAITAAVRHVLTVTRRSKFVRVIRCAKSNIDDMIPVLESIKVKDGIRIQEAVRPTEETLTDKAEAFLTELFADSPEIKAREIYAKGETLGFSSSLLKKVKSILGIEVKKNGFNDAWTWVWNILPESRVPSENEKKTVDVSSCFCAKGAKGHLNHDIDTKKPEGTLKKHPNDEGTRRDTRDTEKNEVSLRYSSSVHASEQDFFKRDPARASEIEHEREQKSKDGSDGKLNAVKPGDQDDVFSISLNDQRR